MAKNTNDPQQLTLRAALEGLTVNQLKERVRVVQPKKLPLRKAELVALLQGHLTGEGLRRIWVAVFRGPWSLLR